MLYTLRNQHYYSRNPPLPETDLIRDKLPRCPIAPNICRYNVSCARVVAGKTDRALDLLEEHSRSSAVQANWLMHDKDWDLSVIIHVSKPLWKTWEQVIDRHRIDKKSFPGRCGGRLQPIVVATACDRRDPT